VRNHYYDRKKKSFSCLSGGCAIVITTGKKKVLELSGRCAIVITAGKRKRYSRLSGGCSINNDRKKKKIQLSVWRVRDRSYDQKIKKFQSSVFQGANFVSGGDIFARLLQF
jgi:hypothetical protein